MDKQTLARLIEIQSKLEEISKEITKKTEKKPILDAVELIESVVRTEANSLKYVDAMFDSIEKDYNTLESILKKYDLDIEVYNKLQECIIATRDTKKVMNLLHLNDRRFIYKDILEKNNIKQAQIAKRILVTRGYGNTKENGNSEYKGLSENICHLLAGTSGYRGNAANDGIWREMVDALFYEIDKQNCEDSEARFKEEWKQRINVLYSEEEKRTTFSTYSIDEYISDLYDLNSKKGLGSEDKLIICQLLYNEKNTGHK